MAVADRDSYLAQRHYVVSAQLGLPGRLMTWRAATSGTTTTWMARPRCVPLLVPFAVATLKLPRAA